MNEAVSPALEGVTISASAARRLNAILKGEAGAALRISVKGGGCSGFQYAFDVERSRAEDDVAVTRDGATRAGRPGLARNAERRRARLRRRPDGPVVQGQEPECGRLLRLRGELLGLGTAGTPSMLAALVERDQRECHRQQRGAPRLPSRFSSLWPRPRGAQAGSRSDI